MRYNTIDQSWRYFSYGSELLRLYKKSYENERLGIKEK